MRNCHPHRCYQYETAPAKLAVRPDVCVLAYQNNRPAERWYDDPLPTIANTVVICHEQRTTSHPFPPLPDQFVQKILYQPLLLDVPGYMFDLPAKPSFSFFKMAVTESFAIPNIRPVARVPVQSMASLRTCSLTFGSQALLVYSSTKLRWEHSGLLQRYLCFPALLCPFRLTCSLPQCGHLMVTVFVTIFLYQLSSFFAFVCVPFFSLF